MTFYFLPEDFLDCHRILMTTLLSQTCFFFFNLTLLKFYACFKFYYGVDPFCIYFSLAGQNFQMLIFFFYWSRFLPPLPFRLLKCVLGMLNQRWICSIFCLNSTYFLLFSTINCYGSLPKISPSKVTWVYYLRQEKQP